MRQLVGRHSLDRGPRQNTLAAALALVKQHLTKGQEVVDRRDQPSGAGRERGRAAPLALGLIIELDRSSRGIDLVAGPEPVELLGRDAETGVFHAEWLENPFAQECL